MSRCWTHTVSGGGLPEEEKRASHRGTFAGAAAASSSRGRTCRAAGPTRPAAAASLRGRSARRTSDLRSGGGGLFEMRRRELRCWTAATRNWGSASCRGTLVVGGGDLCVMEKRELRGCACRASGGGHRKMGRARRAAMPWRSAAATSQRGGRVSRAAGPPWSAAAATPRASRESASRAAGLQGRRRRLPQDGESAVPLDLGSQRWRPPRD